MNARQLALKVIYQVNEEGAFANLALDKILLENKLANPKDKGLATELVYGSIKYRGYLDWVLDQFAKPKVKNMAPWIRNILRLGLYQLLFLDKVPVSAAINESVKLAKKYGHPGTVKFVNGVLRNIERNKDNLAIPDVQKSPVEYLSVIFSFPQWLAKMWVEKYGVKNALKLADYFNQPSPLWIRANTLKITSDELCEKLEKKGIKTVKSSKAPEGLEILDSVEIGKLEEFRQGYFTVQDESSMLVSHVVAPQSGQVILDVCSGPGGKTSHLAQLMGNKGRILAFDVHQHRLKLIQDTCRRLGITNVETILKDARFLSQFIHEPADAVLVDAPCSGLGVLGRRPDARWRKSHEDIRELQIIQKEIIQEAAKLVKPGGTLVYSTCTTTVEENNQVIEDFLANNKEFYLDKDLNKYLPYQTEEGSQGWIQFLPFIHNTDGFFIARMKRRK